MSLKRLPTDVENKISASSDIKNFTKAIEELVYNAFDAKSTSIAVRVFIQEGSIQVVDNGCGISKKDYTFLGHMYYTSKYSESQVEYYGYRGLSLASIIEVSQKVKITSRYHDDTEITSTKTFSEGKEQDITQTSIRPSKGTTVDIRGFLYNYHIQKNNLNLTTEMSQIKRFLERISLVNCNTSISLRDDAINEIVFQINKHRDINQTLQTLYQIRPEEIQELQVEKNEYKIHGFIEKAIDGAKNYHFIYVNGRYIRNNKLQSSIDKQFKNSSGNRVTKRKHIFDNNENISAASNPFYFIFIKCPLKDYDINQMNEETYIEFKNWDKIDKLVDKLIKFYKGDLKVREIKNNHFNNDNRNESNEDTRKQVRNIIQKILDNSAAKRPNRLRLTTGVIGKNATRKDKNKSAKLSISKIVSKQFKCRFNKFYNSNVPKDKNDLTTTRFASIESNKDQNLQIKSKETDERVEFSDKINLKHNKATSQNLTLFTNKQRISQDPLSKKFYNPAETILNRCDILFEGVKEYFVPNNVIDCVQYVTSKAVQTEIDVRLKHRNNNNTYKTTLIKTSHDLIKTIFDGGQMLNLNFSRRAKDTTDTVKSFVKKNNKVNNGCNQKVCSNIVEYSKVSPLNKRKRFLTERSCSNFYTKKTLRKVLHRRDKNKKFTKKNKFRQEAKKHKTSEENLFQKNMYTEQSVLIETFESHFRNITDNNFKYSGNSSNRSISQRNHKLIHEILSSNVRTYNVSKTSRPNLGNTTKYNLHKTYTLEISKNKKKCGEEDKNQWQNAHNREDLYDEVMTSRSDNMFKKINPLTNCETVFQNSIFTNNDLRENLYEYYDDNNEHMQHDSLQKVNTCSKYGTFERSGMNMYKTIKFNAGEKYKSLDESGIYKTLCTDYNNYELGDNNNYDNVSIKSKAEFVPIYISADGGNFHLSANDGINSLDGTKITAYNANANETSKVIFHDQLITASPLSNFELHKSALKNNVFGQDTKYVSSQFDIDFNESFLHSPNGNNNILNFNKVIESVNINENSKVFQQKKLSFTGNEGAAFKENIISNCLGNTEGFKLNSRHNFIPKGMSQITEIQLPNVNLIEELEPNYYEEVVYDNFATNLQTFSEVLEPGVQVLNDLVHIKGIRHVSKPSSNDPIFDAQSLKEAKVLGQVDNKFIGAKVTGRNAKANVKSEFLVLFDQHAVDERIRLENNLAEYFNGDAWNSVSINTVPIKLSKDLTLYLHNYKEKFARFGLEWVFNGDVVSFKAIPNAILGKHSRQIDVIMKAVKGLISEEVEAMKSLKGNVSLHPKSIMDLVLSEACRYAIKFGDILRKCECEELLQALSTCKVPFQCAHGRPVMAVMLELPATNYEYKINTESLKKMQLKLEKNSNKLYH